MAVLEIQDRFKNYYFQKFTKKNDEQIFTYLSFKISPILPKFFCDPEPENLTEVWAHLKKTASLLQHFKSAEELQEHSRTLEPGLEL